MLTNVGKLLEKSVLFAVATRTCRCSSVHRPVLYKSRHKDGLRWYKTAILFRLKDGLTGADPELRSWGGLKLLMRKFLINYVLQLHSSWVTFGELPHNVSS